MVFVVKGSKFERCLRGNPTVGCGKLSFRGKYFPLNAVFVVRVGSGGGIPVAKSGAMLFLGYKMHFTSPPLQGWHYPRPFWGGVDLLVGGGSFSLTFGLGGVISLVGGGSLGRSSACGGWGRGPTEVSERWLETSQM